MSELRRHLRKAVQVEFHCRDESGQGELLFDSADVSAGGAFLVCDMLFELGETVQLDFTLKAGVPQSCRARIAWVRRFPERGQEAGMGVEFLGLTEFDQRAIEAFLEG